MLFLTYNVAPNLIDSPPKYKLSSVRDCHQQRRINFIFIGNAAEHHTILALQHILVANMAYLHNMVHPVAIHIFQ
jgi:hypothetical protein